MAKGQIKKGTTNKPKLSTAEKQKKKKRRRRTSGSRSTTGRDMGDWDTLTPCSL